MTLCIAALAQERALMKPCVVLCFDYKVSNDLFSSESEYKLRVLSSELAALFCGSPGRAHELALLYEDYLSRTTLTRIGAAAQLREPLAMFKRRMAESYVQRRLGFSYQEFLDHGPQWFGAEAYERRLQAIEDHDLRVELIIAGFVEEEAVLFHVNGANGEVEPCTNFSVIGAGGWTAIPALHAREQTPRTSLADTLYNAYEAKRLGEISPSVGSRTRIIVMKRGAADQGGLETQIRVVADGEKWLRGLYRRFAPKPIRVRLDIPASVLAAGTPLQLPRRQGSSPTISSSDHT